MKHLSLEKEVEIKHPAPRRFASHPVLLQRASSIASTLYPRSASDSPGPPPPKSPLRLRRDPRTIESVIAPHNDMRKSTPKVAPPIMPVGGCKEEAAITPTVVTECTGPIKRPRSRGKTQSGHPAYPSSRKEREERMRQRRLRERSQVPRKLETVVNPTPPLPPPSRRLRKPRPRIQIPDLRPAPLVTRPPMSSTAGCGKATETAQTKESRTPVSPVPSQEVYGSNLDGASNTPVSPMSPAMSNLSGSADGHMTLSPVMLVAEEIPLPRAKGSTRPAKLIMKEGKSYAPRPRSASIPRSALKRRSCTAAPGTPAAQTPPRALSPVRKLEKDDTPPLPSPPPNRALPPTPPASGSEKPKKVRATERAAESRKELPIPPTYEIAPKLSSQPGRVDAVPHVASQVQRKSTGPKDSGRTARFDARLVALEKQNAMLSAALMAVLRTNGELNMPVAGVAEPESPRTTAWESRIARRSAASQAASHAPSSSNGSALEMYISTRRGSRHGC